MKCFQGRFLLCDAWPLGEKIVEYLREHEAVRDAMVTGSIRRRCETVKGIDILVASAHPETVQAVVKTMPGIETIISESGNGIMAELSTGMTLTVRVTPPEELHFWLHNATGSKSHREQLATFVAAGNKTVCRNAGSEEQLYRELGLVYIAPELREGNGEIEAAAKGSLPVLVTRGDIQGALHVHTTYSDGSGSIANMAAAAIRHDWTYLGIADHSRTAVYAHGLKVESVLEQRKEIDKFNAENPHFRILAGIESDILQDGSLDYPDEILGSFDFVIASVHSFFRLSEADMTRRIIKAVENRYVSILGHLTGRILLGREGYALDIPAVIKAAADTGTIIEINASPYRLDMDWRWGRHAKEQGVMLAINPDAHAPDELDYVRYGVAVARKGWLSPENIVNCQDLRIALTLLRRKRG